MILPDLPYHETPNMSSRLPPDRKPTLIVVHAWGNKPAATPQEARSRFRGNVRYMCDPGSQVSAHVVYGGLQGVRHEADGLAVQLVPWDRKAWTQAALNSAAISIESADTIWHGGDPSGFAQLARIVAFLCTKTNIPPRWATSPDMVGVSRHLDLGALGNPNHHLCPTTDIGLWQRFLSLVKAEFERGGFREHWGRGMFRPL